MMKDSSRSKWSSTPRLLLIAAGLLVVGIGIAAYPSVQFFRTLFQDSVFPIAEFDANTPALVTLPDANTRFMVMVEVADLDEPMPTVELIIQSNGIRIENEESNGWQSIMGHHYRTVAAFEAPESLTCTITAFAPDTADFGVFHHHTDTFRYRTSLVLPWWIGAAIPGLAGFVLIFFVLCRMALQKDQIKLDL